MLQPLWQAAADAFPPLRPRLQQLLANTAQYNDIVNPKEDCEDEEVDFDDVNASIDSGMPCMCMLMHVFVYVYVNVCVYVCVPYLRVRACVLFIVFGCLSCLACWN